MNAGAPLVRIVGTALLAGVAGAIFAGLAAAILDLSVTIAATAGGVSLALIVGYLVYRYPAPPGVTS